MWSLIAAIAVVVTFMLLVAFAIYRNPKVPHDVLNHICFESTEDLAKALRNAADAHHVYVGPETMAYGN